MVHGVIIRFLTDDVLHEAIDAVTTITQKNNEEEIEFADRLSDLVRDCADVFTDREVVQYYATGLSPLILERVLYGLRNMADADRSDLTAVRRLATTEENSVRSLRLSTSSTTKVRTNSLTRPVLNVNGDPLPPFEPAENDPPYIFDPTYSMNMIKVLDEVTSPVGGSVLAVVNENEKRS